jgi:hypothetical protein
MNEPVSTDKVRSRIRETNGQPPKFCFEIWLDMGDDSRFAIQTGPPCQTREEANQACEEALPRYRTRRR